ncbi:Tim44/TimA family putative adaptor protein [Beijerinckia sp. L45]|uniref:Tim44/TimA family putative adaptor protein n=1 Tax=Beijerinckia sp. L45 TaxID=1641855 RepID=UPI00131CE900|nr:Tim44/TimA family putative adaptor protein [Beijerinckia sp. L45]
MHSLDSLTTIVFALVAIIVIWKLRSVLGERTGSEKPPSSNLFGRPAPPRDGVRPANGNGNNVVRLPGAADAPPPRPFTAPPAAVDRWSGIAAPGSDVAQGLDAIATADPNFSARPFVEGAKIAYEAIVTAFAAGERKTLQNLLAKEVYDSFAAALDERARRGEIVTNTFVSIDEATIEEAGLVRRTARIMVRFTSKLITATHDATGKLVDGSTDQVVDMNDVWSFARETNAKDPNWKLVATESGH